MVPEPRVVSVYLLCLFLIGLGYIAITPPFEGFDEPAHFASIRLIADVRTIPLYGKSFLPKDVADYRGPMSYSSVNMPFGSGLTYQDFFAKPELVDRFIRDYRQPQPHPAYEPSNETDWEAQQPPLYYAVLAPVLRLIEPADLLTQILVLRIASYLMALVGIFFGFLAIPRIGSMIDPRTAVTGYLFYPLILPMFFPEFARMGNDSICLLLAGVAAYLLNKQLTDERRVVWPVALGVTLGLGLLAKAFYLMIVVSIGLFLLVRLWCVRHDKTAWRCGWRNGFIVLVLSVAIGGGWYAYNFVVNGDLFGDAESIALVNNGGVLGPMWVGLKQYFSLYLLMRNIVALFVSWVWAGTWSYVRMAPPLYAPLLLLVILTCGAFIATLLRRSRISDPSWLPVILYAVFASPLFFHVLVVVAHNGEGGTGAWYLHMLIPWSAPALGLGVATLTNRTWSRWLFVALSIYAALFQAMVIWAQIALFTGCAIKDGSKTYAFSSHLFCLDQSATVLDRLAIIGWPILAGIGFGGGLACAAWLVLQRWLEVPTVTMPREERN
jgi:Predicted membrane protein (DUF2142)